MAEGGAVVAAGSAEWRGSDWARYTGGMDTPEKRCWYCPTPGWLVYGSLAVTGLLFLSEKWRWFWFNEHKGWTVLIAVAGVGVVLGLMLLWWLVALVFRWRFQFGIRTLLVLMVAVALPFSWLAVEMKDAREQRATVRKVISAGASVGYASRYDACSNVWVNAPPSTPTWAKNLLGDDFFGIVATAYAFSDEQLQLIMNLHDVEGLGVAGVSDASLESLKGFRQLRSLSFGDKVSAARLRHIRDLIQITDLGLYWSDVGDSDLEQIGAMTHLQKLHLGHTLITDSGLKYLTTLTKLRELNVCETRVTDEAVNMLRQALPQCKIETKRL